VQSDRRAIFRRLRDPNWRIANLYKIVDKNGKRVTFAENSIQQKIRLSKSKRKRILKARQFGVSTGCIISLFDDTIWTPDVTNCIIAHEQDSIKKLFRIVKRAHKFLPDEIRPMVDRGGGSKYEMYFPEINSRIYCDLESRGDTIQNLHISEAAFVQDPSRLKATIEAVPLHGKVTVETTPNGMGNHFYEDWMDRSSTYENLFFPWYMHHEYQIPDAEIGELTEEEVEFIEKADRLYGVKITPAQIAFRRFKRSDLKSLFIQEYPEDDQSCFLASGRAVFDLTLIKELLLKAPKPIEVDGPIKIFERYNKNHFYVVGADAAEGVGGDWSAACMINTTTRQQVATIRGNLKPSEFADQLAKLCEMYVSGGRMHPLLGVERNNHGHAVLLELDEHIRYPNLFHRWLNTARDERDPRPGWVTDKVTRPIMLDAFIDAIEDRNYNLNDEQTLQECLTLVNENGKIQAADGKHDDTIIAAAIALQMCIESSGLELYNNIGSKILL